MVKIDFRKLSWPKSTRMDLLGKALTEKELVKLLEFFSDRPESDRIIRLPRRAIIVKSIIFFYFEKITTGKISKIRALTELELKLGNSCPSWWEMKRLYQQRKREIDEGRV